MIFITKYVFFMLYVYMFSLRFLCRPIILNVLTFSKVRFYFTKIIIIINVFNPFFHLNPMSALTHTPVKILLNVRWQHEAELGRVPCWGGEAKAENPIGWFFFIFIFSICRFLSVLKCLLSMFWEVIKKWNGYI